MERTLIKILALTILTTLSACGASDVIPTGPSTYTVSAQEGLPTGGWPAAEQEAIAKGTQYCASNGQKISSSQEQRTGTPGFTLLKSQITFTCGVDSAEEMKAIQSQCITAMQSSELDTIRRKVELYRKSPDSSPPFEVASNDTFPSDAERAVIAKWATKRDECLKRAEATSNITALSSPLQIAFTQQDRAFINEGNGRVSALIVSLYQRKLTYGEFAEKRYEIIRDAFAAERQFRQASLIADHDRQAQAQQLAQQQFQNNLLAWSSYLQTVAARQPQTVHLEINCTSQNIGSFVSTSCH